MQKISKFKRKDKSNGIPLLQHGFFFLSRKFSKIQSETFFTISFLCCFRISRIMNAKKLEIREGRQEQWNSTSTAWIFPPFHENFPIFIQKLSLQLFIIVCSYFQHNECKEISKFERKTRAMESHFFAIVYFFLSRQFSYEHSRGRQCTTCVVWH